MTLPAISASPAAFATGCRLAAEQRFVGLGARPRSDAVGGKRLADRHPDTIAGAQPPHADRSTAAVGEQALDLSGKVPQRRLQRAGSAMARAQFEAARTEQQKDEHRQRIEADLVAEDAAGIEGGALNWRRR